MLILTTWGFRRPSAQVIHENLIWVPALWRRKSRYHANTNNTPRRRAFLHSPSPTTTPMTTTTTTTTTTPHHGDDDSSSSSNDLHNTTSPHNGDELDGQDGPGVGFLKWYVLFLQQIQSYVTNFLLIPCHDNRLSTSQTAGKAQNTDHGDMGGGWDDVLSPGMVCVFSKIK